METKNLELWKSVEKTNPNYTKKANVGGNKITSISPQYQIMQVTEKFGIYGVTWGFKNIELTYELLGKYDLVVFKGLFFFPNGEFEIINSCKLYMDNAKTKIDDNFAKKIETDSLTKAISKLGFSADIFLGKYDDLRYLEDIKKEFETPAEKKVRVEQEKQLVIANEIARKKAEENRMQSLNDSGYKYLKKSDSIKELKEALENRRMTTDQRNELKKLLKNLENNLIIQQTDA